MRFSSKGRRFLFAMFVVMVCGGLALMAQNPAPPPDAQPQAAVPTDAPLNPKLPTVFIVGDSTARNGADLGWGDHFAPLFDTARINVANRARAGRSSRTYINEGLWAKTLAEMKAGDFLLLQMGHNDGGDLGGAKPRGTLKGVGEETKDVPQTTGPLAGQTETVHTYGWYLRKMIDEAKAKGVHPMLLTVTIRNIWTTDASGKPQIERDMGYTGFIRQVAEAEHIPVVDMATLEADRLQTLGPEKTAALFPKDHTHTSAEGAEANARDVAAALRVAHVDLSEDLRSAMQTKADYVGDVMQQMFGNYDAATRHAFWKPSFIPPDFGGYFGDKRERASLVFDTQYNEGGKLKRFLVFATVPDGELYECHACGVLLSSVVLRMERDGWTLEAQNAFLTAGGEFGQPPDLGVIWLGQQHVALQIRNQYCGHGVCEGSVQLFTESGNHLTELLGFRSEKRDLNLEPCLAAHRAIRRDCDKEMYSALCASRAAKLEKERPEMCTSWDSALYVKEPARADGWSTLQIVQHLVAHAPGTYPSETYVTRLRLAGDRYIAAEATHGPSLELASDRRN